jgi:hypothetical protein
MISEKQMVGRQTTGRAGCCPESKPEWVFQVKIIRVRNALIRKIIRKIVQISGVHMVICSARVSLPELWTG